VFYIHLVEIIMMNIWDLKNLMPFLNIHMYLNLVEKVFNWDTVCWNITMDFLLTISNNSTNMELELFSDLFFSIFTILPIYLFSILIINLCWVINWWLVLFLNREIQKPIQLRLIYICLVPLFGSIFTMALFIKLKDHLWL